MNELEKKVRSLKFRLMVKYDKRGTAEDFGVVEIKKFKNEIGFPESLNKIEIDTVNELENWVRNYHG